MLDPAWSISVEQYYDETTDLYLSHIGSIFQGGLLVENGQVLDSTATVVALAQRAGITDGSHILDAGCGVCGASIAIAKKFENVTVEAITNSSHQVQIALKSLDQSELSDRIHVTKADFHQTQFPDSSFDIIFFFESFGHSNNFQVLVEEMYRVLKSGGHIYIKDVFAHHVTSDIQQQELQAFNKEFFYNTPEMSDLKNVIAQSGFDVIRATSLEASISHEFFKSAIYQIHNNKVTFTELGEKHPTIFTDLPIYFGEILAKKI